MANPSVSATEGHARARIRVIEMGGGGSERRGGAGCMGELIHIGFGGCCGRFEEEEDRRTDNNIVDDEDAVRRWRWRTGREFPGAQYQT